MKFYRVKIKLLKVSDSKQDVSISDSSSDPMTYIQWQKKSDKQVILIHSMFNILKTYWIEYIFISYKITFLCYIKSVM